MSEDGLVGVVLALCDGYADGDVDEMAAVLGGLGFGLSLGVRMPELARLVHTALAPRIFTAGDFEPNFAAFVDALNAALGLPHLASSGADGAQIHTRGGRHTGPGKENSPE